MNGLSADVSVPSLRRTNVVLVVLIAGWLSLVSPPAFATWSKPRSVDAATNSSLSVDAHGDAALVWYQLRKVGQRPHWWYDASIGVAFAPARGAGVTRTVFVGSHAVIGGVTGALNAQGELTVAWVERPFSGGSIRVRAVRRSPAGQWSAVQVVSAGGTAFYYAKPDLAISPSGEVLLTWNAGTTAGVSAAWHTPDHGFGAPSTLAGTKRSTIIDPTPVFDASGAAHVYGTADCDRRSSRGVIASTRVHGRRFSAPTVVTPPPTANLWVSFGADGNALLAWEGGGCSTLEPSPGPPFTRAITRGILTRPVTLDAFPLLSPVMPVAFNEGGGTISWASTSRAPSVLMTASIDGQGRISTPATIASDLVPVSRDSAGDVVLARIPEYIEAGSGLRPPGVVAPGPVAVQPLGGDVPEPAPLPHGAGAPSSALSSLVTAVPVVGRGAALAWQTAFGGKFSLSVWQP